MGATYRHSAVPAKCWCHSAANQKKKKKRTFKLFGVFLTHSNSNLLVDLKADVKDNHRGHFWEEESRRKTRGDDQQFHGELNILLKLGSNSIEFGDFNIN